MALSLGMLAKHPFRFGRVYKRALNMRRGRTMQQRTKTTPPLGTFKDELSHIAYQSHLMPVFTAGSLQSFDDFVQCQGGPPNNLMEFVHTAILGPPTVLPVDIFQKKNWENLQSFRYSVWYAEAVARDQSVRKFNSTLFSSATSSNNPPKPKPVDKRNENLELVSQQLAETLPTLFTKLHNYKLYHPDVIFENRIKNVTTKGINNYSMQLSKYKALGHLMCAHIRMDVLKITTHPEDSSVRVRWRIQMFGNFKPIFQFWKFFRPGGSSNLMDYIDGFSIFYVGDDGLIHKHVADKMMPDDQTEKVVSGKFAKLAALVGFIIPAFSMDDL